jgi:hypothetical protein
MRIFCVLLLFAGGLSVAACGAGEDGFVEPTGDRMVELEKIVAAVDWSKAEERSLLLDEFEFTPADITFKRDQPYELTMTNNGGTAHTFVAPAFFDAVAVQGLIFADGEVSMRKEPPFPFYRRAYQAAAELSLRR